MNLESCFEKKNLLEPWYKEPWPKQQASLLGSVWIYSFKILYDVGPCFFCSWFKFDRKSGRSCCWRLGFNHRHQINRTLFFKVCLDWRANLGSLSFYFTFLILFHRTTATPQIINSLVSTQLDDILGYFVDLQFKIRGCCCSSLIKGEKNKWKNK